MGFQDGGFVSEKTYFHYLPIFGVSGRICRCKDGANCTSSPGKHPNYNLVANGSKNASDSKDVLRHWKTQSSRDNLAIATGLPLPDGGFLGVLDVDPRNGGDRTLYAFLEKNGQLPETVTTETGRGDGGRHYYFRMAEEPSSCAIGPGLDFKGVGGYVLCEPSIHVEGGTYMWAMGLDPDSVPIATCPDWLYDFVTTGEGRYEPSPDGRGGRDTFLGEAFSAAGWLGTITTNSGSISVRCPWAEEHSDGRGFGDDTSSVILPPKDGSNLGLYMCSHSHCAGRKWDDVLKKLPERALDIAKRRFPLAPVHVQTAEVVKIDERRDVYAMLKCKATKNGSEVVVADSVNLNAILTYDPDWRGALRMNDFTNQIEFTREPQWHKDDKPAKQDRVWGESDPARMVNWLNRSWDVVYKNDAVINAVQIVSERARYHPVQEWLNTLIWDGTPRVKCWLYDFLNCTDPKEYLELIGPWWLISATARAFEPGCKVDTALILEGPQGFRKSSALSALCPDRSWFTDTHIDIGNKDAYLQIRGKWLVELAELTAVRKADVDKIKGFISSQTDSYRAPYAANVSDQPRVGVFCGSINPNATGTYFRDETGNRRFFPCKVGSEIDVKRLATVRDQLWAEVVTLYRAGAVWYPTTPTERAILETAQHARAIEDVDPWHSCLVEYAEGRNDVDVNAFLRGAMAMASRDMTPAHYARCTRILRAMGWRRIGNSHVWVTNED